MANDATFYQSPALKAAVAARVPLANVDDGMNKAGSCAPGVGIGTGSGAIENGQWTLLDQKGASRDPQASAHIGEHDDTGVIGDTPINWFDPLEVDFNDTFSLNSLAVGWVKNSIP